MEVLWLVAVAFAFGFAYTMQFSGVTLQFGRALAGEDSGTGYQDAITPPWQTKLALIVYLGSFTIIGAIWWKLGWASGLGALALILVGSSLAKIVLPKPAGPHYKNLIMQSMCSRYADFVTNGDSMRADAMKELLVRAGINPDAMKSA
jgi:hypothetical protein